MKRWLKWFLSIAGCIFLAVVAAAGWYLGQAGPTGSGFVAKYLCSSTFVSRREPMVVFQQDVAPVNPLAARYHFLVDREKKRVTVNLMGLFERTAIWREGCGCTLVAGISEEQMRSQPLVAPGFSRNRPQHNTELSWPQGNAGPVRPDMMGIDSLTLNRALDRAFAEPGLGDLRQTRAVVVVYNGRLVAERYAPGIDRQMPLLGWSMSKSITNALVGILVKEGKLSVKQSAPVPEWRGDPRKSWNYH